MKILVIGAGITGCTLARLLKDKGYDILIMERMDHIGGLCYTKESPNGILYEPYGAHTFHTKDDQVKEFVQRFTKFNTYVHNKGIIINGILRHYPLSLETINKLPECNQILKELKERPKKPIMTNFESYIVSLLGKTLYKLFIQNYTYKMWGINPRDLTAEWAPKRIELRKNKSALFEGQWQGLPTEGYTKLFETMIKEIPIDYSNKKYNKSEYDLVLFSGKIDELLNYKYGALPYRSLKFEYKENENWENENYGTINLPQDPKYIRKANFKILYQQKSNYSWIQYQEPIYANDDNLPMYPIGTNKNFELFNKYLRDACESDKKIPVGRLGLYKYLDMDKAVALAFDMIQLIDSWTEMKPESRYLNLKSLIAKY